MILVVCLNPALQRILWFNELDMGEVNRARQVTLASGGKGLNVARVLAQLNVPFCVLLPLGGYTGQVCEHLLDLDRMKYDAVKTGCPTRICTTLIARSQQTELVEEGGPITSQEFNRIYQKYHQLLAQAQMVIIAGSAPAGIPDDFYYNMAATARKKNIKCVLDAQKEPLRQGLSGQPWLAKPNLKELAVAMAMDQVPAESIKDRLRWLLAKGAQIGLVTDGKEGVFCYDGSRFYHVYGPPLTPVNAIGSGDALCAGLCKNYLKSGDLKQAVRFGTACAMANVLTPVAGSIDVPVVRELLGKITITEF